MDRIDSSATHSGLVQKSAAGSEQPTREDCPPFCSCACCSVARYIPSKLAPALLSPVFVGIYGIYLTPDLIYQSPKIWQPPQLG